MYCVASGTTVSLRSLSWPSAACGRFVRAAGPSGPQCAANRGASPPSRWSGYLTGHSRCQKFHKCLYLILSFSISLQQVERECKRITTPLLVHWRGGIPPALKLFQCIIAVLCIAFFVCLVPNFIACLVSSFRYNGLATLALAGPSGPRAGPLGPLQALWARGGPFGPAMH